MRVHHCCITIVASLLLHHYCCVTIVASLLLRHYCCVTIVAITASKLACLSLYLTVSSAMKLKMYSKQKTPAKQLYEIGPKALSLLYIIFHCPSHSQTSASECCARYSPDVHVDLCHQL